MARSPKCIRGLRRSPCAGRFSGWLAAVLVATIFLHGGAATAALVGYWPMDEANGSTVYDFTALGNNGTLNGSVTWAGGHTGNSGEYSLSWPGASTANYVSIPLSGALQAIGSGTGALRSFTVAAWVKPSSQANYPEVWCFQSTGGNRGFFYQGGNPTNSYVWSDSNGNFNITTNQTIGNNAWHHVAVTFDGNSTTNNLQFWYDGVMKAQRSVAANQALALAGTLLLGKGHGSGNAQNWNGLIDDMVVFNSLESVASVMNGTNAAMQGNWTGGGAGPTLNWSDSANWGGGTLPASRRPLVFDTATGLTANYNDFTPSRQFKGITFNAGAGAFTLGGNAVNLTGDVVNNSANPQTIALDLYLDGGNRTFNAAVGDIRVTGPIHQAIGQTNGLVKSGSGTLTLSGSSDYVGATSVSGGRLVLSGMLGGTPVTVAGPTSILSGSGSTTGPVAVQSSGRLAPGGASAPGTLSLGGLSLSLANLDLKLGPLGSPGVNSDRISVTGDLVLLGNTQLFVTQLEGFTYGDYDVLDYSGSLLGGGIILPPASTALHGYKVVTSTPNQVSLHVYQPLTTLTWAGTASAAWDIDASANWTSGGTAATYRETEDGNSPVAFDDTAAGTTEVVLDGTVSPFSLTFGNTVKSYTIGGAGGIAGPTGLTVNGGGSVVLATANSFVGDTAVTSGTLTLAHAGALAGSTLDRSHSGTVSFGDLTAVALGGLKGGQNLAIANASGGPVALTVGGNDQNTTYGGTPSGGGSLTKTGNGTLTLTADSVHSGNTTVSGGNLVAANLPNTSGVNVTAGTLSAISYASSAGLTVAAGAAANLSGANLSLAAIANAGKVHFTATSGTITLASLSGFSGTTSFAGAANIGEVSSGIVQFTGSSGTIVSLGAATVNLAGTVLTAVSGTGGAISGNGSLVVSGGSLLALGSANYSGGTTLTNGTLSTGYVPGGSISFNGGVWRFTGVAGSKSLNTGSSGSFLIDVASGNLTITRHAGNYNPTVMLGAGTLTVANGSAEDGGNLQVDAGTVVLAGATNIGQQVANVGHVTDVKPGATLKLANNIGGQIFYDYTFHMSGGTFDVNGTNGGQIPAVDGSGTISNGSVVAGQANMKILGTKTFSGNIVDAAGRVGVNLNGGGGTWILSGANTYSGATTVGAGTLKAASTSALSPNSVFNVGTTLDLGGYSNQVAGLTGAGTVTNSAAGLAVLTVNNDAATSNADTTFSGVLRNGGAGAVLGLAKNGSGKLTLSRSNNYSGGTVLNGGTIAVTHANSLGATGGSLAIGGATLEVAGSIASARNIGVYHATSTIQVDPAVVYIHSGSISGPGSLNKTGAGTLVLAGSGSIAGATNVPAGVLQVNGPWSTALVNLTAAGLTQGAGQLAGSGTITLTSEGLYYNSTAASTFSGVIAGDSPETGLEVLGGILTLGGNNLYQGGTTVSGGTLIVTNASALPDGTRLTVGAGWTGAPAFSGSATWTSTSGTLWNSSSNWLDNNAVAGVPGVAPRPNDSDTAAFSGSGSVTTIGLTGVNPSLKSLAFSGSDYTLSGGSLTLKSGTGAASIAVTGGTHSIGSRMTLASDLVVTPAAGTKLTLGGVIGESGKRSLTLSGSGALVLSGSDNSFSGGTIVSSGTLIVTNAGGLLDGTSLTVGADAAIVFASASVPSPAADPPVRAVPEPGTAALLLIGLVPLALRSRRRGKK